MRNYLFAFSSVAILAALFIFNPFANDPKEKEEAIIKAVRAYLDQLHYQPVDLNDEFSEKAYNLFIESIDGNKRFLTKEDLVKLEGFKTQIDDEMENYTLLLFNEANGILEVSIDRAEKLFEEEIDRKFDFSIDESIELDPEKREFADNEEGLREYWRKTLKYDILSKYYRTLDKQEKDVEKREKKIAEGKEVSEDFEVLTKEEILVKSQEDVKESFEDWFKRLRKIRRSDRFESYVNSILHVYDPHSDYFNPKEKADFDIRMSGKLEGIGARLSVDGDYTKVVSIVPGGPAWRGKELEVDDLISAVKQEKEEEALNIEGMRLDDVVSKIRGKKGTKVTLTVKKPDGTYKDVTIERDVVITEEGNAKSVLINLEGVDQKIGYTYLPSFYADFKTKNGRSCAVDIEKELEKLTAQNVDGIILDLRNNGGGSLRDVVDMGGLFVEEGPMVQVKPKDKKAFVLEDEDSSVQYDGPLIIMVNDFSVSASEILAAALQDYNRAVIVGSPSTFGKGSVQRFFSLDRVRGANEFKPLGDIKMTIQKFFRIDGTSTQLKGVESDIVLPDSYLYIKRGEKDYDYPLKWNEIEKVDYKQNVYQINSTEKLKALSEERVQNDKTFQLILENAERLKENSENRVYSLQIDEFVNKIEEDAEESKKYKDIGKDVIEGLMITNLEVDMPHIESDSSRIGRNEDFISRLTKDIYLKETVYIMDDLIEDNN